MEDEATFDDVSFKTTGSPSKSGGSRGGTKRHVPISPFVTFTFSVGHVINDVSLVCFLAFSSGVRLHALI